MKDTAMLLLRLFQPVGRNIEARHRCRDARHWDSGHGCATCDIQHAALGLNIEALHKWLLLQARYIFCRSYPDGPQPDRRIQASNRGRNGLNPGFCSLTFQPDPSTV